MNLPPKALKALVDLKRELLSREAPTSLDATSPAPGSEKGKVALEVRAADQESRVRMRHARRRGTAFQGMCQRGFFR
jgi:hypothetical protein